VLSRVEPVWRQTAMAASANTRCSELESAAKTGWPVSGICVLRGFLPGLRERSKSRAANRRWGLYDLREQQFVYITKIEESALRRASCGGCGTSSASARLRGYRVYRAPRRCVETDVAFAFTGGIWLSDPRRSDRKDPGVYRGGQSGRRFARIGAVVRQRAEGSGIAR